ncbi:FAD-binding oxidoreductase [Rhodoligotrophos defluvii]|uniref:FAD-binding oxidoreductase n=1 Tax=Rhodoligotrophos defluvii TaxID=2561934 RepID=UPI0010C94004|nr:FAD-binding oxidoreductase [Rhodoligotrophos defluvii]
MSLLPPSPETLARFAAIVDGANALRGEAEQAPFLTEWRDLYQGRTPMVLLPGSTDEVAAILALANETRTAIVPQSGNTGLVGGQIPNEGGTEIVLSLKRMNRIRDIDPIDNSMIAEAGCILSDVQAAAHAVDRMFPLSLAAEGSCRIGGNISSNAGGINVLAYGNTRQLVLGLEVVLADGRIWNGLRRLKKDNTGYDLKQLFIGAEGTLGVVTAAVLKLLPKPTDHATAIIAVVSPRHAVELLNLMQQSTAGRLTAFELIPRIGLEFTMRHADVVDPFATTYPWYVLAELSGGEPAGTLDAMMMKSLEAGMTAGLVQDAVPASSEAQRNLFWRMREALSEVQKHEGGSIKHDVSVPVARIPAFLDEAMAAVERLVPGSRPVPFGHLGDGNIHFNVSQPVGADKAAYLARWSEMNDIVHGIVLAHGGSISAEHGIGRLKRSKMADIKSPVELAMMQGLKRLFDPNGILNPGKLLP